MNSQKRAFFGRLLGVITIILTLNIAIFALDAVDILNSAVANVTSLETISLELKVEVNAGFSEPLVMVLQSHLKEEVARLEFTKPREFSGQIIIVDKPKDQYINYYPTGQAVRMPLSKSAEASGMGLDMTALMNLNTTEFANLDQNRYLLAAQETNYNGSPAYLITVTDRNNEIGTQKVWLAKSDKFPLYMESYDNSGNMQMSMTLHKVEKNQGLSLENLRALPKGAVVFDM